MRAALRIAVQLCKRFEGLRLSPYLCPAGVPTTGYGTVYKPDGTKVSMDDPAITADVAELWLIRTLEQECIPAVLRLSPRLVDNEQALGALGDFVYNLGSSRYKTSTLRRRINEGDWDEARNELARWVRSGGIILPGLVKRRAAESEYME